MGDGCNNTWVQEKVGGFCIGVDSESYISCSLRKYISSVGLVNQCSIVLTKIESGEFLHLTGSVHIFALSKQV